ncbi:NACHT domain-containing protein [Streptomycetaceae bacterium NBC_01309]
MSGAAVFVGDLLMGLVVEDPGGWKHGRLEVLPATEIVPQIRGVVAAHARWEPNIHRVEDRIDFDGIYALSIERQYGSLNVFGIDLSRAEHAVWPLETAYLSLETVRAGRYGRIRHPQSFAEHYVPADVDPVPQRVEEALADRPRVLIRGAAGSGKTTLMQWLATTAARRDFVGPLAHLNGRIPFVLPMRTIIRHNEKSLPPPGEFLRAANNLRASAQPQRWADAVLASGRALLLVDGLDEVPQSFRNLTRQWLGELTAEFPETRCVVTARPSATPEGWLNHHGFEELALAPMSRADVRVFVRRWHDTARAACEATEEADQLVEFEQRLIDGIGGKSDLARLVTNPLMCALVCALNRDRRAHLPRGRKELYDAGLRLLLVRRDEQHDIRGTEEVELTEEEQTAVLQRLAYWLIRNGRSEADQAWFRRMIGRTLPDLASLRRSSDTNDEDALAERVFRHLLGRSGLLREPTVDTVDFVHRTFQDYLGARAAVEEGDIGVLIEHAHDDQWEDVLRMAVAHGRPKERSELIRGLVERGDRESRHRVRLHLLAWSCTGEAPQVDADTQAMVAERASTLLPPRDGDMEKALIEAGPVVLDLLPSGGGLGYIEGSAEIRVAGGIGGDAAMIVLREIVRTSGSTALNDVVCRQWVNFPTEVFATEVIAHLAGHSEIAVRSRAELAELARIGRTADLGVRYAATARELADLVDMENLTSLSLWVGTGLASLDLLRGATRLQSVLLDGTEGRGNIPDAAALAQLPALVHVALFGVDVAEMDFLPVLPHVTAALVYEASGTDALEELVRRLPALGTLKLFWRSGRRKKPPVVDLAAAAGLPLRKVSVEGRVVLTGAELFPPGVVEHLRQS